MGSTSYLTDKSGEVSQHVEYFPFGGVMVEERHWAVDNQYLFNGKELDEETGLYYYGARYYDPKMAMWYGVDPLAEKYAFSSPYAYCVNNPVILVDPDGEFIISGALALKAIVGAAVGATMDIAVQVTTAIATGKAESIGSALGQVDWTSVGTSAVVGALGVPGSNLSKTAKTIVTGAVKTADATTDISIENGTRSVFNETKTVGEATFDLATSVVSSKASGTVKKGVQTTTKAAQKLPTVFKAEQKALSVTNKLANSKVSETVIDAGVGITSGTISSEVKNGLGIRNISGSTNVPIPIEPIPADATRVVLPIVKEE